jgi:GntR family transcriptional regulator
MSVEKEQRHYREIAGALRESILSGKERPGAKLPSERELSAELGASRVTVRRALRLLEEERLLRRVHGSGAYVSPAPAKKIPLMIDYGRSMREHAPNLGRVTRWQRKEGAPAETAAELMINPGEKILRAFRVDLNNGAPAACDDVFIADFYSLGIGEKELNTVDFISAWEKKARFRIHHCVQRIEAVPAGAETAAALNVKKGAPLLKSTEVYFAGERTPAGLFISYYNPEFIRFESRHNWN